MGVEDHNESAQWKAIRDIDTRLRAIEEVEGQRKDRNDLLLTKVLPLVAALTMAACALISVFHWPV